LGVVALGRSDLAMPSLIVFGAAYAAMNLGAFAVVARVGADIDALVGTGGCQAGRRRARGVI